MPDTGSTSAGAEALVYVGHATLLLELAGARLLTDPCWAPASGTSDGRCRARGSRSSPDSTPS